MTNLQESTLLFLTSNYNWNFPT